MRKKSSYRELRVFSRILFCRRDPAMMREREKTIHFVIFFEISRRKENVYHTAGNVVFKIYVDKIFSKKVYKQEGILLLLYCSLVCH